MRRGGAREQLVTSYRKVRGRREQGKRGGVLEGERITWGRGERRGKEVTESHLSRRRALLCDPAHSHAEAQ